MKIVLNNLKGSKCVNVIMKINYHNKEYYLYEYNDNRYLGYIEDDILKHLTDEEYDNIIKLIDILEVGEM